MWGLCDGRTTVESAATAAGLAPHEVAVVADEFVSSGLASAPGYSRRRMLQGGALAGGALLTSVLLPAAQAAASTTSRTYNLYTTVFGYHGGAPAGPFFFYQHTGSQVQPNDSLVGAYTPVTATNTLQGVRDYEGTANNDGTNGFPLFFAAPSGLSYGTVNVPANAFALHPSTKSSAIVAFTNTPAVGAGNSVTVSWVGTVFRRDTTSSGDGVRFSVRGPAGALREGPLAVPLTPGSSVPISGSGVVVPAGRSVYFIVDNGGAGNYNYDITQLDLNVTVT